MSDDKKPSPRDHAQDDKARDAILRAARPEEGVNKDPDHEAENPAPMEEGFPSAKKPKPRHHDLEGQQGGQKGGSREPL